METRNGLFSTISLLAYLLGISLVKKWGWGFYKNASVAGVSHTISAQKGKDCFLASLHHCIVLFVETIGADSAFNFFPIYPWSVPYCSRSPIVPDPGANKRQDYCKYIFDINEFLFVRFLAEKRDHNCGEAQQKCSG